MKKIANLVFNAFTHDSRVLKESISLSNNGYSVEVIAHLDKQLPKEETKHNFKVKRFSYLDRTITKRNLGKLKAYIKYLRKSVKYCKSFDYIHCNDLNTLPVGVIIKRKYNKKIKIVYDAHEYQTETHALSGMKKRVTRFLEKKLIKYVDAVITVSDSIANEYVKLYGISKPYLVLNNPPFQKVNKKNLFRETLNIQSTQNIFLYQGGLSVGRGIETLLDAFKQIDDKNNVIVFMGYGELEDTIKQASKEHSNIHFYPAVSPAELLDYTGSADYGISLIEDSCLNYRYCLPNKMFEYIMAGLPFIVSNLTEMKKIVEQYKVGVVVKENSLKGLIDAIAQIVKIDKQLFAENLQLAQQQFNWENQEKVLVKIYKELC